MFFITFDDFDPTIFNFVSDMISVVGRWILGIALSYLYVFIMSWHIKKGGKQQIPASIIGYVPGDFFGAIRLLIALSWSSPALVFAFLFLVADFSHSIADLGLSFVTVQKKGPNETILDLTQRNSMRPIQTAGDPNPFRASYLPVGVFQDEISKARAEGDLISSFLNAAELIARGGSPFVADYTDSHELVNENWFGIPDPVIRYQLDNGPLTEMNLELPLDCKAEENVQVNQIGFFPLSLDAIQEALTTLNVTNQVANFSSLALVPNCTFDSLRQSGIFGGNGKNASVLETVSIISSKFNDQVFLRKGDDQFQNFVLTPALKRLARDRQDWRFGRSISSVIDSLVIGNLNIPLGAVVLATGPEVQPDYVEFDLSQPDWIRYNRYGLMGEIVGECPPRPSGFSILGTSCYAFMKVFCPTFEEDYEWVPQNNIYLEDTSCQLSEVKVIWGRGFVADSEMVSVLAGMYGRVQPDAMDPFSLLDFELNAIHAASFALGSLSTRPSLVEHVSPRINAIYIVFMTLPFLLTLVAAALAVKAHRSQLPIPRKPWEVMVFARGQKDIPKQDDETRSYPKPKETLRLHLIQDHNGKSSNIVLVDDSKYLVPTGTHSEMKNGVDSLTNSVTIQQRNDDSDEQEADYFPTNKISSLENFVDRCGGSVEEQSRNIHKEETITWNNNVPQKVATQTNSETRKSIITPNRVSSVDPSGIWATEK